MINRKISNYFVSSAHSQILLEALRELEGKVKSFLDIGCELHGQTIIMMQPKTFWDNAEFFVSQATIRIIYDDK